MSERTIETDAVTAPESPPARRGRTRTLLLMLAVFLCGGVCGGGLTVAAVARGVRDVVRHPEQLPERTAHRLTQRLDLTPEQQAQVRSILEQHHQSMRPAIGRQMRAMRAEIEAVLTSEQKQRWESMFERRRRKAPRNRNAPPEP